MFAQSRKNTANNPCLFFSLAIFSLALFCLFIPFSSADASENQDPPELPEKLDAEDIDTLVATMGDEQVRRLLIDELRQQAEQEKINAGNEGKLGGIARSIQNIKDLIMQFRSSIARLNSAEDVNLQKDLPNVYKFMGNGGGEANPIKTILSVVFVFVLGLLINWIFGKYVLFAKKQIEDAASTKWTERLTGLIFRAFLDIISITIFITAVILSSFLFLELTAPQRILIASYLTAFAIVLSSHLILKFLLAPHVPGLRLLPITDHTAIYLHRRLMAIVVVACFGLFTCGVFRLAGLNEAHHYLMVTLVGFVIAIMFIVMILQNKQKIAGILSGDTPETSLQSRLARYWHHMAIIFVVLIVLFSMVQRLFYGMGGLAGIKTLLVIGLYFLFDWLLRTLVTAAFGIANPPEDIDKPVKTEKAGELEGDAVPGVENAKEEASPAQKTIYVGRMKSVIRIGLRLALLIYMLFWIVGVWGLQLTLGETISNAMFSILITVLVCYIVWELINAKIQQKLKDEMPDDDEEMEEGGSGGSRMGTLLLLLQKFFIIVIVVMVLLVALSSLGVDIGPLIAGAGIVGLAIGLGAQTLVRDIIAGIFFLIDDAFRLGDYIEVSGIKGSVEKISIRSFKLRNPRGMLNTIPFGNIGTVTNYSRDYIITKLNFRVRYDTDVEKVRKVIKKKVYKVIAANEELGPKLLNPIKSQGVRQMDDSAMIMRVKYKTAPGEQFVIRKEVYRLLQEAFKEEGIEFAHKNVTVYMPPGNQEGENSSRSTEEKLAMAAAAALAAEQTESEDSSDTK
jgi:small-conductance mechanosensitive channel